MKIVERNIKELIGAEYNPRELTDKQHQDLRDSLQRFGLVDPVIVNKHKDRKDIIIGGHQRTRVWEELGNDTIATVELKLTLEQERELNIRLNKNTGQFDMQILAEHFEPEELIEFGFEPQQLDLGFYNEEEEEPEPFEDQVDDADQIKTNIVEGDLIEIGPHRLLCGDSTDSDQVAKLMNGERAHLGHNDPPYGMKKEKDGVMNDNLNLTRLLDFNREWIPLQLSHLLDNGSFYCWGQDSPLMDVYAFIMKPYIDEEAMTFRNLITWDKAHGMGQLSNTHRQYATADEKCLFVMKGAQEIVQNKDQFPEEWREALNYFIEERKKMGWNSKKVIEITGKTTASHYFTESQFLKPTKEAYEAIQAAAEGKAFTRPFNDLKVVKFSDTEEGEVLKDRAYFDNLHDNMNNVWHYSRTSQEERQDTGGHATPKPVELCDRVIKTSSPVGGLVLDMFLGSGSTMVSAHRFERRCFGLELSPKYCQVIINRMKKLDSSLPVMINGSEYVQP